MAEYSMDDVKRILNKIAGEFISAKARLTEIDSKLGDGDMGISMEKGAVAVKKAVSDFDSKEKKISKLLLSCAAAFNNAAPSTMGTLLSMGMMAVGKELADNTQITEAEIAKLPGTLANAIAVRGKASVGDKTILDALVPYSISLQDTYEKTGDLRIALNQASLAAFEGMESTKGIIAKTGRAKWIAERNMEYPDGGAVLCYLVAKSFIK